MQRIVDGACGCHIHSVGSIAVCSAYPNLGSFSLVKSIALKLITLWTIAQYEELTLVKFITSSFVRRDSEDLRSWTITLSRHRSETRYWWFKLVFIEQPQTSCAIDGWMMGSAVGLPLLAVETMYLMPPLYLEMIAFLLMGSYNFGPDKFKQASCNNWTLRVSGARFDVRLFYLALCYHV